MSAPVPLHRLEWQPGLNAQQTQTKNRGGWFSCNLIRWRLGLLEKLAGWLQLFGTPSAATVRAIHALLDLFNVNNLLLGTDDGAQLYRNGQLQTLTFNDATVAPGSVVLAVTSGSKTVTVTQTAHGLSTGINLQLPVEIGLGTLGQSVGVPANTSFPITVINANTYTFQMPDTALINNSSSTNPQLRFDISPTSSIQQFAIGKVLNIGDTITISAATSNVKMTGSAQLDFSLNVGDVITVSDITLAGAAYKFVGGPYGVGLFAFSMFEGENINQDNGTDTLTSLIVFRSNVSPAGQPWSLDNFGSDGIVAYENGPIYIYTPPSAQLANAGFPDTAPQINTGALVTMPQAQIVAYGSEITLGGGVQDPLLIRFSDAGNYAVWTATAANQAGSFRLGGSGSRIIAAIQAPQTTLIFTDVDLWSMQYVGPPFIYSFTTIGSGCGLVAQRAIALLGRTCLWVSQGGFFTFSDSGIAPLLCPVWDVMFTDLDKDNIGKVFCGTNSGPHEIWIFYPSLSGGTGECDKYLKYNVVENLWDFGSMRRTAWLEDSIFGSPLAADDNLLIQQHEIGYDANGLPMAGVFAESGYTDIGDGNDIMFCDEFISDMKWFGENGAVSLTIKGLNYPGDNPTVKGPYGLDSTNRFVRPSLRSRQIAIRLDWVARLGFSARLGTPRARSAPSGRRP